MASVSPERANAGTKPDAVKARIIRAEVAIECHDG
jgi:hypothetical protein